jgi:osmotically-inducible protein OsmY
MRKYGKWLLMLGVMAAVPTAVNAEGFLSGRLKPTLPFSGESEKARNQEVAEHVASALREARLNGYDIEIEVRDGLAILDGKVRDVSHRALATQVVSSIAGVRSVENNLRYVPQGGIQQASATRAPAAARRSEVVHASVSQSTERPAGQIQQVSATSEAPASNQQVAEQIAGSLSQSGLIGYDIEVRFSKGVASLGGQVATPAQRQAASQACSRVPGVRSVNNQLQVARQVQQTGYAPQQMAQPMQYPPQQMPASMMRPGMQPGMMPPSGIGAAPVSYNNPHLPSHAWPSYAQYPNSAAVTYPTQYSASAWPYIGPFYPYPQVPLGWREASLEWDDGFWQMNFNKSKDKWYWILNPHHK